MENETTAAPGTAPHPPFTAPPAPIADVAIWLKDEIAETNVAIMGVHHFAAEGQDPKLQLDFMKAAARMMQAQAAAAVSLQHLTGGKGLTVTIVHEKRNTPPPEKSKTNGQRQGGVEELWEDEDGVL